MASFNLIRKLPPCGVDRALLQKLEQYLQEHAPCLCSSVEERQFSFSVEVADPFGTETLESAEHLLAMFTDNTRTVQIKIQSSTKSDWSVRIMFSDALFVSYIDIEACGGRAREGAVALFEGIRRILECNKSGARFFHPFGPYVTQWFIGTPALLLIFRASGDWRYSTTVAAVEACVGFVLAIYLTGGLMNPYTAFACRKVEARRSRWLWLVRGIGGFVLFTALLGTVVTVLRKHFLGF